MYMQDAEEVMFLLADDAPELTDAETAAHLIWNEYQHAQGMLRAVRSSDSSSHLGILAIMSETGLVPRSTMHQAYAQESAGLAIGGTALEAAEKAAEEAGRGIIGTIGHWLTSAWSWVSGKFRSLYTTVLGWFKKTEKMPESAAQGVKGASEAAVDVKNVEKAAEELTEAAAKGTKPMLQLQAPGVAEHAQSVERGIAGRAKYTKMILDAKPVARTSPWSVSGLKSRLSKWLSYLSPSNITAKLKSWKNSISARFSGGGSAAADAATGAAKENPGIFMRAWNGLMRHKWTALAVTAVAALVAVASAMFGNWKKQDPQGAEQAEQAAESAVSSVEG